MDDWEGLIEGRLSTEDVPALIAKGAEGFDALLERRPDAAEDISQIIASRTAEPIADETWRNVHNSLVSYMSLGPTALLEWVIIGEAMEDPTRLQMVDQVGTDGVSWTIRSIVGRYGLELVRAWIAWGKNPQDWQTFFREVYEDQILRTPVIRVRILKYNGEDFLIEGNPSSLLDLARNLILTLQLVARPDAFNPDLVDLFVDEANKLEKLIASDEEESVIDGTQEEQA